MYSDEDIASAVKAGILTEQTALAFRNHVAEDDSAPAIDEESFRLITGFNDIFVVIASLLLLSSVTWIGSSVSILLGVAMQTVTAWGLAEYFTRKRRMALPSIMLLLAFVGGVLATGMTFLQTAGFTEEIIIGGPSVIAALAAWLHWLRFKVPITVAAGAGTLVAGIMFLLFASVPETRQWLMLITFVAGIGVFSLAMWWDSADTLRQTRRSDVAFWLHLIAAPLIVHPIFAVLNIFDTQIDLWQAVAVTVLYIFLAIISISIDRRALMVSALIYVLYVFNSVLEQYGVVSLGFAFTAFIIGSGLLLLSAFWHRCRQIIIVNYPVNIQKQLPKLR
jgi:hypothetical protein